MLVALWIILGLVALLLLFLVVLYNRLVRLRNSTQNAWAQVDVQLKRRHDLIPNLIETVKGYAAHERGTFEAVTAARTAAQKAQGPAAQAEAENVLTQALGKLFAVAEAYPQLRATENFQQLQAQLAETEDKIQVSRQVYNDTVLTYNNSIQTVPSNIVAGAFGFKTREFFEVHDEAEREAPQVSFPGADQPTTGATPPATDIAPPAVDTAPPAADTTPQPPAEPGAPPTPPQT
jgi:LemA protein